MHSAERVPVLHNCANIDKRKPQPYNPFCIAGFANAMTQKTDSYSPSLDSILTDSKRIQLRSVLGDARYIEFAMKTELQLNMLHKEIGNSSKCLKDVRDEISNGFINKSVLTNSRPISSIISNTSFSIEDDLGISSDSKSDKSCHPSLTDNNSSTILPSVVTKNDTEVPKYDNSAVPFNVMLSAEEIYRQAYSLTTSSQKSNHSNNTELPFDRAHLINSKNSETSFKTIDIMSMPSVADIYVIPNQFNVLNLVENSYPQLSSQNVNTTWQIIHTDSISCPPKYASALRGDRGINSATNHINVKQPNATVTSQIPQLFNNQCKTLHEVNTTLDLTTLASFQNSGARSVQKTTYVAMPQQYICSYSTQKRSPTAEYAYSQPTNTLDNQSSEQLSPQIHEKSNMVNISTYQTRKHEMTKKTDSVIDMHISGFDNTNNSTNIARTMTVSYQKANKSGCIFDEADNYFEEL